MVTFMPGSAEDATKTFVPDPNATWMRVEDIPARVHDVWKKDISTEPDSKFLAIFKMQDLNPIASTASFTLEDCITSLEYLCGRAMHLSTLIPGATYMRELRKQWKLMANTHLEDFRRHHKLTIAARGYELLAQEILNDCYGFSVGASYDLANMDPDIWMIKYGKRYDPLDVQDACAEMADLWEWHTDTIDKLMRHFQELSRVTYSDAGTYTNMARWLRNYARRDYDKIAMELGDYREIRHRIIRNPATLSLPVLLRLFVEQDPVEAWLRIALKEDGPRFHDAAAQYPGDFVASAPDVLAEMQRHAHEARRAIHGKSRATN